MYRYFLALRYLINRPINLIGMAGVTVGVWALILVVSIFSGFLKEVRHHVHAASSDITVIAKSPVDFDRLAPVIRRHENVAACAPRVVWYGMLHALDKRAMVVPRVNAISRPGADSPFVKLMGIDARLEAETTAFRSWLADVAPDRRVDDLDDPLRSGTAIVDGEPDVLPGILLSNSRVDREFIDKGAAIKITSARLHNDGRGNRQQITFLDQMFRWNGAYHTGHHGFDDATCFVSIEHLRSMMDPSGLAAAATEIVVRCVDPSRSAATAAEVEQSLHAEFPGLRDVVIAFTWQELNRGFLEAVDHQRSLMKLVLFVIMVVAAFLMYATLSMMVTEKTHDIGILTAMGATRRGVLQVFLSCGLTIVVIGALVGVIAGCLSSIYLDAFTRFLRSTFGIDLWPASVYNLEHVPYDIDVLWIVQVAAMALVVGIVVAGLPAWRAARHDPLISLREE